MVWFGEETSSPLFYSKLIIMLLEILHKTAGDYLKNEKILSIDVHLTPHIYELLQREINEVTRIKTEVPIEGMIVESVTMYKRTVKITRSDKLDSFFEKHMTAKMLLLEYSHKTPEEIHNNRMIECADDSVRNLLQH